MKVSAVVVAVVVSGGADAADESPAVAIVNCRAITAAGEDVPSAVVVVKGGRIESVGPWTKGQEPAGADVFDAKGGVLAPAFVHAAGRVGMRDEVPGDDETIDAARTAASELNPWLPANAWAAANGFATLGLLPGRGAVGGRGVAVRAAGASIETMVRKEDAFLRADASAGQRFASSVGSSLAEARKELDAQAAYDKAFAEYTAAKSKAEAEKQPLPKEPEKPKLEPAREPWRKALRGETALLVTVEGSAEVHVLASALSDERVRGRSLRVVALCGGDAYRAAGALADLGAICVVRAGLATWPNSTERICPAVLLRNAGCRVVLLPRDDTRAGLRDFPLALAQTVRAGFPRGEALRAATSLAAETLGLAGDTGAIEKGRRADLVLWSADPLASAPRIERVWIDGALVEETP